MGKLQELHEASRLGYYAIVERILVQMSRRVAPLSTLLRGSGINAPDSGGYTALHHAALNGHKDIVALLMCHEARPDAGDSQGTTPLHLAAWAGHADVVHVLLVSGPRKASVDCKTISGDTPLHSACHYGHTAVARLLLEHRCDPSPTNGCHLTPLMLAARHGRLSVIQLLLDVHQRLAVEYFRGGVPSGGGGGSWEGSAVDVRRINGESPLHLAARYGHTQVVSYLVESGFDVNICNLSGTALFGAAVLGKLDVVKCLLDAGVDTDLTDERGYTVLQTLNYLNTPVSLQIRQMITDACKNRATNTKSTHDSSLRSADFPSVSESSVPTQDSVSPSYQNVQSLSADLGPSPVLAAIVSEASLHAHCSRRSGRRRFKTSLLRRAAKSPVKSTKSSAASESEATVCASGDRRRYLTAVWPSKRQETLSQSSRSLSSSQLLNFSAQSVVSDETALGASSATCSVYSSPTTAPATSSTVYNSPTTASAVSSTAPTGDGDLEACGNRLDDHWSRGISPPGGTRGSAGHRSNIVCGTRALTGLALGRSGRSVNHLNVSSCATSVGGGPEPRHQFDSVSEVVRCDGGSGTAQCLIHSDAAMSASLSQLSLPPRKPPRRSQNVNAVSVRSSPLPSSSVGGGGTANDGTYELLSAATSASHILVQHLPAEMRHTTSGDCASMGVSSPCILQSGAESSTVCDDGLAVVGSSSMADDGSDDNDDSSDDDDETVRSVRHTKPTLVDEPLAVPSSPSQSSHCVPVPSIPSSNPIVDQAVYMNVADARQSDTNADTSGSLYSNVPPAVCSVYENFTPCRWSYSDRMSTTTTAAPVLCSGKTPVASPRFTNTSDGTELSNLKSPCAGRISNVSDMCDPPPPDVAAIHISEILMRSSLCAPPCQDLDGGVDQLTSGREKEQPLLNGEVDCESDDASCMDVAGERDCNPPEPSATHDSSDIDSLVTGSLKGLYRGAVTPHPSTAIDVRTMSPTLDTSHDLLVEPDSTARDDNNNSSNNSGKAAPADNQSSDGSFMSALEDVTPPVVTPDTTIPATPRQRAFSRTFSDLVSSFSVDSSDSSRCERTPHMSSRGRAAPLSFLDDLNMHELQTPLITAGYDHPRFLRQLLDDKQLQLLGLSPAAKRQQLLQYIDERLPDGVADVCQQLIARGRQLAGVSNSPKLTQSGCGHTSSSKADGRRLPRTGDFDTSTSDEGSSDGSTSREGDVRISTSNEGDSDISTCKEGDSDVSTCREGDFSIPTSKELHSNTQTREEGHSNNPKFKDGNSDIPTLVQGNCNISTSNINSGIVCRSTTGNSRAYPSGAFACDVAISEWLNLLRLQCHYGVAFMRLGVQLVGQLVGMWGDESCAVSWLTERAGVTRAGHVRRMVATLRPLLQTTSSHSCTLSATTSVSLDCDVMGHVSSSVGPDTSHVISVSQSEAGIICADSGHCNTSTEQLNIGSESCQLDSSPVVSDKQHEISPQVIQERNDAKRLLSTVVSDNNNDQNDNNISSSSNNNNNNTEIGNNNSNNKNNKDDNTNENNDEKDNNDSVDRDCRDESHDWLHRNSQLLNSVVQYEVNYVGSARIKKALDAGITRSTMQKLRCCCSDPCGASADGPNTDGASVDGPNTDGAHIADRGLSRVLLAISHTGVSFFQTRSKELICEHPICNINCVCQDDESLSHFAYVTLDKASQLHYCHVFCADNTDMALEVMLTLGQAFELAYRLSVNDQ